MTMQVIQRIELGSDQASIDLTSIPGTFTDLLLVTSLRSNRSGPDTEDSGKIEFNGSSANFSYRWLRGDGSSASSNSGTNNLLLQNQNNANTTSNTFTNAQLYIANYTSSANKSVSVDSAGENNATAAFASILAGLWSNSAAITSIAIKPNVGTAWVAGSSATLYGITKGSDGITTVS